MSVLSAASADATLRPALLANRQPSFPCNTALRGLQHTKIAHFNAVLGLCGLAVVWRAASLPAIGGAAGLSVSNTVGDVLTIIAVAAYCLMCML